MARILCVWEQGTALGHLSKLRRPIELALAMGHSVALAARELHRVKEVMGDMPITYLQAPFKPNPQFGDGSQFQSFTHLLARQCFSSADELEVLICAWRALFDLVQPHVVLFEHSPTALVAAWPFGFKKVLVGNGFVLPPIDQAEDQPFAPFRQGLKAEQVESQRVLLLGHDEELLAIVNAALRKTGGLPIPHLSDLYGQAHAELRMTWPQLDHFGERRGAKYLGAAAVPVTMPPVWPAGEGAKVFGYLQGFPQLGQLLADLKQAPVRVLLCIPGAASAMVESCIGSNVRISTSLFDLQQVGREADWVVSHANHSTTATLALAGVPQLLIPRHQEQYFLALRLVQYGAAAMAFQDQSAFSNAIEAMNTLPDFHKNALKLCSEMAPYDPAVVDLAICATLN